MRKRLIVKKNYDYVKEWKFTNFNSFRDGQLNSTISELEEDC